MAAVDALFDELQRLWAEDAAKNDAVAGARSSRRACAVPVALMRAATRCAVDPADPPFALFGAGALGGSRVVLRSEPAATAGGLPSVPLVSTVGVRACVRAIAPV